MAAPSSPHSPATTLSSTNQQHRPRVSSPLAQPPLNVSDLVGGVEDEVVVVNENTPPSRCRQVIPIARKRHSEDCLEFLRLAIRNSVRDYLAEPLDNDDFDDNEDDEDDFDDDDDGEDGLGKEWVWKGEDRSFERRRLGDDGGEVGLGQGLVVLGQELMRVVREDRVMERRRLGERLR